jgi:hypothetical protein
MAQPSDSPASDSPEKSFPHQLDADSHQHVLRFPDRSTAWDPTDLPDQSAGRPATPRREQVSTRTIRQVAVLGVGGQLRHSVEDLDRAIELALADGPRGVICDLSAARESEEPFAVDMLATAGRHVRDWPAIPVVVVCPDPQVREALRAHRLGRHLIVAESLFCAVSAVLAGPTCSVESRRLMPHPTAPHAARNFVTRTLLNWQLNEVAPSASQVASELVASSSINAGTDIDLSLTWNHDALRLAVRDQGPGLPGQAHTGLDLCGKSLTVVAEHSRAFGVLPTTNGGKVVWAVLEAPRPTPPTSKHHPKNECQEPIRLNHAQSSAGQPSRRILERNH